MAHVGEFAFVLLSASSQFNILPYQVWESSRIYMA